MKVVYRLSNKEIYNNGGLLCFRDAISKCSSLESITRRILPKGVFKTNECIMSYISNLAIGKSDFEAINLLNRESLFKATAKSKDLPSEETVRQRMDELAQASVEFSPLGDSSLIANQKWIKANAGSEKICANELVSEVSIEFLKRSKVTISPNAFGYVTVDIDTTTLDNSKTKKEKVEFTYMNFEGYSPIAAFIGEEGWSIASELRPGAMHGQKGFGAFLQKIIARASYLTPGRQLYRMDCAFDAVENYGILFSNHLDFVIKRNNGRITNKSELVEYARRNNLFKATEKTIIYNADLTKKSEDILEEEAIFSTEVDVNIGTTTYKAHQVYLVRLKYTDKDNNRLLFPAREVHAWMTSLPKGQEEVVIELYKQHATSEQFHSEFKTDLDLVRLPSGKFETNKLVFNLAGLVYNVLKFLGNNAESEHVQMKRHTSKRRRIRTIIQEVINVPIMLGRHARNMLINFCRHSHNFALLANIQDRMGMVALR